MSLALKSYRILASFMLLIISLTGSATILIAKENSAPRNFPVSGKVTDSKSKEAIAGAVISIGNGYLWAISDENGRFFFDKVQEGSYQLETSCLGYVPYSTVLKVGPDTEELSIPLSESTLALDEVVVTAKKDDALNTSLSLDRTALNHLQMSNMADISALLPGGKTINPDLTTDNVLSLRAGGSSAGNAAFGTALEVDGVRIGNNAAFGSMAGTGTRSIAVENIESVEVVTGVPSAEYGDLNSGMVKINTRKGRTPVNITLAVNPRTWSASVSKGFDLKKDRGVLNVSGEWTKATSKLTSPYTSYTRRGFSVAYSNTFARVLRFEAGFTGNIGGMNSKDDPDAYKGEWERTRDNVFRGNASLTWLLNKTWITNLKFDASVNFQDNLNRHYLPEKTSATPLPAVHAAQEGYFIADILPTSYAYDRIVDSKELDYAASVKYDWYRRWGDIRNVVKAGVQWKASGNRGQGEYYTDPSLASDGWRADPYSAYPFMHNLSVYAEDHLTLPVGKTTLEVTAGLRMENVFIKGSLYNAKTTLSPRLNAKWTFNKHISVRGGWGVSEKLPSFYILYPKQEYNDIRTFDFSSSSGNTTYIYYTQPYKMAYNPDLKWQRNSNAEVGIDASFLGTKVSLTGFCNVTRNPYKYSNLYTPFSYNILTQPEGFVMPSDPQVRVDSTDGIAYIRGSEGEGWTAMNVATVNRTFTKQLYQDNGADILRAGAELIVDFPEIRPIRTSFRLDASYTFTEYADEGLSYYYQSGWSHTTLPDRSYQYVGIYANGGSSTAVVNGRRTHNLDANLTAITHIPQARIIITCRLEMSLVRLSQNLSRYAGEDYAFTVTESGKTPTGGNIYDGNSYTAIRPVAYLDLDGNVHEFTDAEASDPEFANLILKSGNAYTFALDGYNPYFSANISITKEIGKHLSFSFFANNFTNSRKAVTSYATGVSAIFTPAFYYGLTCRIKF
ncbi:MAG: TonB-dependent receptor domain-containing protein [Candidatus Cryptobacteroides sp.]